MKAAALAFLAAPLIFSAACAQKDEGSSYKPAYLTASTADPVNADAIRIGATLQDFGLPIIQLAKTKLEEKAAEYGDEIELTIMDGQSNIQKQNGQVEYFVSEGVDVIIMNAISFEGSSRPIMLCNDADIPIVTFITGVVNESDASAFARSSNEESGRLQMDMLIKEYGESCSIAILEGSEGSDMQRARSIAYDEKLAEMPDIRVAARQRAGWHVADSYAITKNWIALGRKLDAIITQSDSMAMGALMAIEEADADIGVFGINGDHDALCAVNDGRLKGTVFIDIDAQVENALSYAVRLAKGESIHSQIVPQRAVSSDNAGHYIKLLEPYAAIYAKSGY